MLNIVLNEELEPSDYTWDAVSHVEHICQLKSVSSYLRLFVMMYLCLQEGLTLYDYVLEGDPRANQLAQQESVRKIVATLMNMGIDPTRRHKVSVCCFTVFALSVVPKSTHR